MNAKPQISLEAERATLNARYHGLAEDVALTEERVATLQRAAATGRGEGKDKLAAEKAKLASLREDAEAIMSALRRIETEIQQRDAALAAAAKVARGADLAAAIEKGKSACHAVDAAVDALHAAIEGARASLLTVIALGSPDKGVESEVRDRLAATKKNALYRLSYHLGEIADRTNPNISVGALSADVLDRRAALGVKNA